MNEVNGWNPTDLQAIADEELLNIIYDNYQTNTFDGLTMFEPESEEFYIHINTARGNLPNTTKGRFTLAHELGHYFLPHHRLALMRGTMKPHGSINYLLDNDSWKIEREADDYASSLLMPSSSFKSFVQNRAFSFHLIMDIAEQFHVSIAAAALKFVSIGNYPIMVIYGIKGKLRWAARSQDFPFLRLRYGSSRGDKLPENSVMGDYFYHDIDNGKSEEEVRAGDCFDTQSKDDNERCFIEWCIPYKDKALSVFWEKE